MRNGLDRRSFLKLAGLGGAVLVTGVGRSALAAEETFFFVQLSDTHWGFQGPVVNPDARGTLPKAIAAVNALPIEPDFVIFTGDLTHTTDDPAERRKRLTEFREQARALKNPNVRYMAGEFWVDGFSGAEVVSNRAGNLLAADVAVVTPQILM